MRAVRGSVRRGPGGSSRVVAVRPARISTSWKWSLFRLVMLSSLVSSADCFCRHVFEKGGIDKRLLSMCTAFDARAVSVLHR